MDEDMDNKNSVTLMCQNDMSRLFTDCRRFELIYYEKQ